MQRRVAILDRAQGQCRRHGLRLDQDRSAQPRPGSSGSIRPSPIFPRWSSSTACRARSITCCASSCPTSRPTTRSTSAHRAHRDRQGLVGLRHGADQVHDGTAAAVCAQQFRRCRAPAQTMRKNVESARHRSAASRHRGERQPHAVDAIPHDGRRLRNAIGVDQAADDKQHAGDVHQQVGRLHALGQRHQHDCERHVLGEVGVYAHAAQQLEVFPVTELDPAVTPPADHPHAEVKEQGRQQRGIEGSDCHRRFPRLSVDTSVAGFPP